MTGFRCDAVEAALTVLPLCIVHNHDYAGGMGRSLATVLSAPGTQNSDGVLIMLADMPNVTFEHLDRLITAFRASAGLSVIRARSGARPGHPVVLFEIGSAALHDIDTLDDLLIAGGSLPMHS